MGLGPSIKMTTLHHFNCPVTKRLNGETNVDFAGIIVDGVSEGCDEKEFTALRTAVTAQLMRAEGAIVAIDGWGNHHVDFVSVIGELGKRGIPAVGLSYIGLQGRLVCSNAYTDCVVDFNKSESGYESCVVGQNNLTDHDAVKAVALLINKMKKAGKYGRQSGASEAEGTGEYVQETLMRRFFEVRQISLSEKTSFKNGTLCIKRDLIDTLTESEQRISSARISVLTPEDRDVPVNSNLDFMPVACKADGIPGSGITHILKGVSVMLTGVEETSGYQPSNIGSSEGLLNEQVVFGQAGTPGPDDHIIHVDVLFKEGEARTAKGIMAAHRICDKVVQEIRKVLKITQDIPVHSEMWTDKRRKGRPSVVLIKIVSGLGNMYDTTLFPFEPGGFCGSHNMMDQRNVPCVISPAECIDGMIHSLV